MDHTALGKAVDHGDDVRQIFAGICLGANRLKVADGVTGRLATCQASELVEKVSKIGHSATRDGNGQMYRKCKPMRSKRSCASG